MEIRVFAPAAKCNGQPRRPRPADWAQNCNSRYRNCLNGPSRGKLGEFISFMFTMEAIEDDSR